MTRLERFLAKPPRRISAAAIRERKARVCGSGKRRWLPSLIREQGGICFYCPTRITMGDPRGRQRKATLDHYIPLSKGGPNERSNCVAACLDCNRDKADMTPDEFKSARATDTHPKGRDRNEDSGLGS